MRRIADLQAGEGTTDARNAAIIAEGRPFGAAYTRFGLLMNRSPS
jgi:hypothetical protein